MPQFLFGPPTHFLLLLLFSPNFLALRSKREGRAAFDLLRLEQNLDFFESSETRPVRDQPVVEPVAEIDNRGGEDEEERCRQRCNEQLRMGLDMVKAHSAFGSIGVPSVVEPLDLQLFCRLDAVHDQCLIGCGYQVQFNMRDFVCKRRREELISHLECFTSAAAQMKRQCGPNRCGPYNELELSIVGVGQRCRTLLCDLDCTQQVLIGEERCRQRGRPAAQYLLAYSQLQVFSWLRQMLGSNATWQTWPRSCARLICGSGPRGVDGGNCSNSHELLLS